MSNTIRKTPSLVWLQIRIKSVCSATETTLQGMIIALVRSYLRMPETAGQVKILIFLVNFFPIYANDFCDAGQVPILRYFES